MPSFFDLTVVKPMESPEKIFESHAFLQKTALCPFGMTYQKDIRLHTERKHAVT